MTPQRVSRREFLKVGGLSTLGLLGAAALQGLRPAGIAAETSHGAHVAAASPSRAPAATASPGAAARSYTGALPLLSTNPHDILTDFDYGKVSRLPNGRTLREYDVVAVDREIEVAKGVKFAGWTYNGRIPGPTLRCTEGDVVRIHFRNEGSHAHTIHFHGIHPPNMDGVFEVVPTGGSFTYEFTALPFGVHLYHCHVMPLKKHIHKGLYGFFIIDPKTPRPPATEMVMMMNGFDVDFDGENEFYTVNGYAFAYNDRPIRIRVGELVRVYLGNITEFDLINSFHLHAEVFHYYPTGTKLSPDLYTDTIMQCQGERGILEFRFQHPGRAMFHAHQSEFAELGWMGLFEVVAS